MAEMANVYKVGRIIDRVRRTPGIDKAIPEGTILEIVNEGIRDFCRETECHDNVVTWNIEINGDENDSAYPLPYGHLRTLRVTLNDERLIPMNLEDLRRYKRFGISFVEVGTPVHWYELNGNLNLFKRPGASQNGQLLVAYTVAYPPELENRNHALASSLVPWSHALIYYALKELHEDQGLRASSAMEYGRLIVQVKHEVAIKLPRMVS